MIKVAIPITGKEEYRSIKKVIFDGNFVSGKNVDLFERKFSNIWERNMRFVLIAEQRRYMLL